jgi:hypothetical protein
MFFKKILFIILLQIFFGSSFLFSQIKISSNFESGSIGSYHIIDSNIININNRDSIISHSIIVNSRFDPLNPVDTSLRPSARWYFFKMTGVKNRLISLYINNSEVLRPFYSYDGVNFARFDKSENRLKNSILSLFSKDTVYISHFKPYTYSRHIAKIKNWQNSAYVTHEYIGNSSKNIPIDFLTITDNSVNNSKKKRVWIHGRSHPSEAPSSWHLEFMIDNLLSDNPLSKNLLQNTIFYIIPVINPDGVIGGFSRSSSTGVNIEINWDRPDSLTMPEVENLRSKLIELTNDKPLDLLLNMHSQIANSITYWIHTAESTNGMFLKDQMLLSSLTINHTPYYRPQDQRFSNVSSKYIEGWIWDNFKDSTMAITFETPYTYYNEDINGDWVSIDNLKELAHSSVLAICDYLSIGGESRKMISYKNFDKVKGFKSIINDPSKIYHGKNYYISTNTKSRIDIIIDTLSKGVYKLYKWNVGENSKVFPDETNRWELIDSINHKTNGKFKYRYKSVIKEDMVNNFILVKE